MEFSVLEAENLGTTLKDQLTSAEAALGTLKEENKLKDDSTARLEIELEETSEQLERSVMEKARLQQESDTLVIHCFCVNHVLLEVDLDIYIRRYCLQ